MSSLPLNDRQFAFWRLRCTGLPNVGTANRFSISRQAVSGAACIPGGHVMSIMKTIRAYLGWCPVQGAMRTSLPVRPGMTATPDGRGDTAPPNRVRVVEPLPQPGADYGGSLLGGSNGSLSPD
jgi:hypothetical protein